MKNVDDALLRQLRSADGTGGVVGAVITIRSHGESPLSAAALRSLVARLLGQAEKDSGEKPSRTTVFSNLQSFAVEASPRFLYALLEFDDIESAIANVQDEDLTIRSKR